MTVPLPAAARPLALAVALVAAAWADAPRAEGGGAAPGPAPLDLGALGIDGMVPILDQRFSEGLSRRVGDRGLWSTNGVRGTLMTNAAETVFLDAGILGPEADAALPPILETTPAGLSIRTVALAPEVLGPVRRHMRATGQGAEAGAVRYATGRITTAETWAQAYGYFEIEARIPRGRGRWPAFWLNFAGPGWPPELDVFEAYGEGIARATPKDGRFNTAVHFDALDAERREVHAVDIVNPHDAQTRVPRARERGGRDVFLFSKPHVDDALGADIYGAVHTYAALWTPEEIVFLFGPDRGTLREIYRVPTPDDAHDPMFLVANDQFTARGGWWPADDALDAVLSPANDFLIESITVRALRPDAVIDLSEGGSAFDPASQVVRDTPGDDVIAPGEGFDVIELSGGADTVRVSRGRHGKVVTGFGPDDRLVIDGFGFDSAAAHGRLHQVGADVWLSSGADPFWPQSVILRDVALADVAPAQIVSRWAVEPDIWLTRADLPNRPSRDEDGDGRLVATAPGAWLHDDSAPVRMDGGPGGDRFVLGSTRSQVREPAGGGIDAVIARGNRALPAHVERGILRGNGGRLRGGPGDDRLEAEGARGTLAGRDGDDLYVIAPGAVAVTVAIDDLPGHDLVRGWGAGHRLVIAPTLLARDGIEVVPAPEGAAIRFAPDVSVTLEGVSVAEAETLLPGR